MQLATRRLFFVASAVLLSIACDSHTITMRGPATGRITLAFPKSLASFDPTLAAQNSSNNSSNGKDSEVVAVRVQISISGESRLLFDKTFSADTVCNGDSDSDTTANKTVCTLTVPFNYPSGSERATFQFLGDALDPAGATVYKVGPASFTMSTDGATGTVTANAVYVGPGSDATAVVMSPHTTTVTIGTPGTAACTPTRPTAASTIAFAPMRVSTSNSSVAEAFFTSSTAIQVVGVGPGTARITCELDFGTRAQDFLDVTVTGGVPTSGLQLQLVSGGGQSANVNSPLPSAIFVRVVNSQGQPVSGVLVSTGIAPQNGSVNPVQGVTSVSGIFSTNWTLGSFVGQQSLAFAISGGSGVLVTATAR